MDALNKAEHNTTDPSLTEEEGSLAATENAINQKNNDSQTLEDTPVTPDVTNTTAHDSPSYEWSEELSDLPNIDDKPDKSAIDFPPVPKIPEIDEILAIVSDEKEQTPTTKHAALALKEPLHNEEKPAPLDLQLETEPEPAPPPPPIKDKATKPAPSASTSVPVSETCIIPAPNLPDIEDTLAAIEAKNQREDINPLLVHNPLQTKNNHLPLYITLLVLSLISLLAGYYVYIELQRLENSHFSITTQTQVATEELQMRLRGRQNAQESIETIVPPPVSDESTQITPVPPLPETLLKPEVEPIPTVTTAANPSSSETEKNTATETLTTVNTPETAIETKEPNLLARVIARFKKDEPDTSPLTSEVQQQHEDKADVLSSNVPQVTVHSAEEDLLQQKTNRLLKLAYQAYINRDDASAALYYRDVLELNPGNYDALLGIATVSIRLGKMSQAEQYYQILLNTYPEDMYAEVGLIMLSDQSDSEKQWQQQVVKIKKKIKYNTTSSNLHALLGHLYMQRQHWDMAKDAYFEAYRYADQNPNYAFDLAVSLEKLDQSDAALRYYKIARGLAVDGQEVSFSLATVENRIQLLKHQSP